MVRWAGSSAGWKFPEQFFPARFLQFDPPNGYIRVGGIKGSFGLILFASFKLFSPLSFPTPLSTISLDSPHGSCSFLRDLREEI
jgi:hypothetical protein